MGLGADMTCSQRQSRLAALEGLDLALLVTTKHYRLLGRLEVKSDNIPEFGLTVRISRKLEDTREMRLDFVLTPDPLYGGFGDPQRLGQRSTTPARTTLWRPGG